MSDAEKEAEVTDLEEFVEACDLEEAPSSFDADELLGSALDTYRLLGYIEGVRASELSNGPVSGDGMEDLGAMNRAIQQRSSDLESELADRFGDASASGGDSGR